MAKKVKEQIQEEQVEQVENETSTVPEEKGVLTAFVENVAQGMMGGRTPIALIAVFDQEGTISHTKFLHRGGSPAAIAGELQRIGLEALFNIPQKNITS